MTNREISDDREYKQISQVLHFQNLLKGPRLYIIHGTVVE